MTIFTEGFDFSFPVFEIKANIKKSQTTQVYLKDK